MEKHCILPEIGEQFWFKQQVSDIPYAYIPDNLLIWSLHNWNPTNLIVFHLLKSFKNQFVALNADYLANKTADLGDRLGYHMS